MPKEVYELIDSRSEYGVLDIGGDDRGALALGRYVPSIIEENDYEMLLVVNKARPLTRNVPDTLEVVEEMVAACKLPFTGIVNNTNLGPETTAEDVIASIAYANEVSEALGNPVKMTCCDEKLYEELKDRVENLFPLSLQKLYYHLNSYHNGGATILAKLTFKEELCKGCGLCVNACPKNLLQLSRERLNQKGHSPVEITEPEKCIGCAFCATMCPDCVIKVEK